MGEGTPGPPIMQPYTSHIHVIVVYPLMHNPGENTVSGQ